MRWRVTTAAILAAAMVASAWSPAGAAKAKTRLVSKTSAGVPADGTSTDIVLSASGRFAAFQSIADNLPGTDEELSVYVHDRKAKKTRLVSKTSSGQPAAGGQSRQAAISADGRFVAFESTAPNLPAGNVSTFHVYVHDLDTRKTRLVSKTSSGQPVGGEGASISASGRYVLFTSNDVSLPGGNGVGYRVYIHDRKSKKTWLVSKSSSGTPASSFGGRVSGSGNLVAFTSSDQALPKSSPGRFRVYVHDRRTQKTRFVSPAPGGDPFNVNTGSPEISGNGRVVAFVARHEAGEACVLERVYAHDRKTKRTRLVSKSSQGTPTDRCSGFPVLTKDGRVVAFQSNATNLPGGGGFFFGIYTHQRATGKTRLVSKTSSGAAVTASGATLSSRGELVGFTSLDDKLPGAGVHAQVYTRGPLR